MHRSQPGGSRSSIGGGDTTSRTRGRMINRNYPNTMNESEKEKMWGLLKRAIDKIQHKNNSELSFEELYRTAYQLVLHRYGDMLYDGTRETVLNHLKDNIRNSVMLQILHKKKLKPILDAWDDHKSSMGMIKDVLMYMDRVHVKSQKLDSVQTMGIKLYRDQIIHHEKIKKHVRDILLQNIETDRLGEQVIDNTSIKKTCDMLMELGCGTNRVYSEIFEQPFLQQSKIYFAAEAEKRLGQLSSTDYLKYVDQLIPDEENRIKMFLDTSTIEPLKKVLVNELLTKHADKIVNNAGSGAVDLMMSSRYADLERMHRLLLLCQDHQRQENKGLTCLENAVRRKLNEDGTNIVNQYTAAKDPFGYTEKLIQLYKSYEKLTNESFSSTTEEKEKFTRVQTSEFEKFLNPKDSKTPEFLSLFIDMKLKKGGSGSMSRSLRSSDTAVEESIDDVMDNCIILFRLVEAKDEFERYYKSHLCRRMLNDKVQNEDNEQSMIQKLKHECGTGFTTKLENMHKDQQIYRSLNERYKNSLEKIGGMGSVQIEVKVLTCGMWPISASTKGKDSSYDPLKQVPQNMMQSFEQFKAFYLKSHENRRLNLIPDQGTAEIKFTPNHPTKGKRTYVLSVISRAAYLISLFNEKEVYTFAQLKKLLGDVPDKQLKVTLAGLIQPKQQILKKISDSDSNQIKNNDKFEINDEFYNQKLKINMKLQKLKIEDSDALKEIKSKVDEDRRCELEAAIVRTMKARQTLSHNQLTLEVIEMVKARFTPDVKSIKNAIGKLLEKEYLRRSENNATVYEYLA